MHNRQDYEVMGWIADWLIAREKKNEVLNIEDNITPDVSSNVSTELTGSQCKRVAKRYYRKLLIEKLVPCFTEADRNAFQSNIPLKKQPHQIVTNTNHNFYYAILEQNYFENHNAMKMFVRNFRRDFSEYITDQQDALTWVYSSAPGLSDSVIFLISQRGYNQLGLSRTPASSINATAVNVNSTSSTASTLGLFSHSKNRLPPVPKRTRTNDHDQKTEKPKTKSIKLN